MVFLKNFFTFGVQKKCMFERGLFLGLENTEKQRFAKTKKHNNFRKLWN